MRNWVSEGRRIWERYLPQVRDWSKSLRVRHINLFVAMTFSLAGAVLIAIAAAWLLAPLLNVGTQTTPPADLTRLALTTAAGVGGVVALVVAYRRQRDLEQGRFVEGFGAAAKQLGDADVAVRLAGVYAMAGVADQASKLKRQQCIDVLCSYLRLPYSPELGNNHQSSLSLKKPVRRKGGFEEELMFQYRQNDREVRQTIVRVIAAHLQKKSASSWSSHDFDFTGAYFEEPDFGGATFGGKITSFRGATFSGERTWFARVIFSGENTSFDRATFSGENTSFAHATFGGEYTWFDEATFRGENTWFDLVTFSGENTSFDEATFSGKNTSFNEATFSGKNTSFTGATFSSENTIFEWTKFFGGNTSFIGATFSSENTSFRWAHFLGRNIWFDKATFGGGSTSFARAKFGGGNTWFVGVDFGVGPITFEHPRMWKPAPTFDWDSERDAPTAKPTNVEPQDWPPVEVELLD